MLSYADENDIKYKPNDSKNWELCHGDNEDCILNCDCNKCEYRIKQKPTYRPFRDKEECWNEMLKHQPFGWLKNKTSESPMLIGNVYMTKVSKEVRIVWATDEKEFYSASKVFTNYVFADETPFGIKED